MYVLKHPSDPNLFKIGVTRRDPCARLKEHNTHYEKAAGKVVRDTGQLWELLEVVGVADVYQAEREFWKRPPLTELPYSYSNELLNLKFADYKWVKDGLKAAANAGNRSDPTIPPIPKPVPKRGGEWLESQLKGTGIKPIKNCGNGITKVWFSCEYGHVFKIGGYMLVGGYELSRQVSCPLCQPENFTSDEHKKFIQHEVDNLHEL